MSDHRTCDRCPAYWPYEFCCCSCDILTCTPLGLSLGVPSSLLGDGLCLVNRTPEPYVRWNYCYVISNKHVLLWPRCPCNMSRRELRWKNWTSSSFSLSSTQCACSPLNLGASRRICVRLYSVDFPAILFFRNNKKQEESGQIDLRFSCDTSARNLLV